MKSLKTKAIIAIGALTLLTSCVSDGSQDRWVKTPISNAEQEYVIANGECKAESYKAVPAVPASSDHCVENCFNQGGFARGFQAGATAKQQKRMRELRTEIYEGCMMKSGWEKVPD